MATRDQDRRAASITALHDCLMDGNPRIRESAAMALNEIGEPANACIHTLSHLLSDSDVAVRSNSIAAISRIVASATIHEELIHDLLPILIGATRDGVPSVRGHAVRAIAAIAASDEKALDAIVLLIDDDTTSVRVEVASAVGLFGAKAKPLLSRIGRLLTDESVLVRTLETVAE